MCAQPLSHVQLSAPPMDCSLPCSSAHGIFQASPQPRGWNHTSCVGSWVLYHWVQFSSVQSLRCVQPFATPWIAARQASLSITNSWSPPKPMSVESVMPSNHLILCRPLLFLPSIFPSIRVFSNESALHQVAKYWSFSFSISPSNEPPGMISTWEVNATLTEFFKTLLCIVISKVASVPIFNTGG